MPYSIAEKKRITKNRLKAKRKRKLIGYSLFFLVILIGFFYYKNNINSKSDINKSASVVPAATDEKPDEKEVKVIEPERENEDLKATLDGIIKKYPSITPAIIVAPINTKDTLEVGSKKVYTAASTTKTITAACTLKKVQAGNLKLASTLSGNTVRWQIQQMVQQSNNDSWAVLLNYLGRANIKACAQGYGITTFNPYVNSIAPKEEAMFLRKLYNGQILNTTNTNLLLSFMKNTNNEKLIPSALPGINIFHKYGNLDNLLHDTAIIEGEKSKFVLVIFTEREPYANYTEQTALIHDISKAVYNFYN